MHIEIRKAQRPWDILEQQQIQSAHAVRYRDLLQSITAVNVVLEQEQTNDGTEERIEEDISIGEILGRAIRQGKEIKGI